jgi:hypothetical protein
MTNLERWLKRFRAGASQAYQWTVALQMIDGGPRQCLRACTPEGMLLPGEPCPLTMQQHLDGFPSMLGSDLLRVIAAADGAPGAEADLRATLLHMCHVEDKSAQARQDGALMYQGREGGDGNDHAPRSPCDPGVYGV